MYNLIEKAWNWLAYGAAVAFTTILVLFTLVPSKVTFYSLSELSGKITIQKHVDWSSDDFIPLDRSVSYKEAVELVKELNSTIK